MNISDNYDAFVRHEAEQFRQLKRYPICEYCEEHITDERAFCIEDSWYHKNCMDECFGRDVLPE
jgi:hypothetical protein